MCNGSPTSIVLPQGLLHGDARQGSPICFLGVDRLGVSLIENTKGTDIGHVSSATVLLVTQQHLLSCFYPLRPSKPPSFRVLWTTFLPLLPIALGFRHRHALYLTLQRSAA